MKKPKILIIVFLIIVGLSFAKDAILKFSIEQAVHSIIGLRVKVGSLRTSFLFKQIVDIKDLNVLNPSGYKEPVMINIPEIYLDYDIKTVLSSQIFIHELRLDLKEFEVVKNEKGVSNVEHIKLPPQGEEKKDIAVGKLHLKITQVRFKDYAKIPPLVREYNINIDEKLNDIPNLNALVRVVLFRALSTTAIKNLTNYDMNELRGSVDSVLSDSKQVLGGVEESIEKTKDSFKSLFGK